MSTIFSFISKPIITFFCLFSHMRRNVAAIWFSIGTIRCWGSGLSWWSKSDFDWSCWLWCSNWNSWKSQVDNNSFIKKTVNEALFYLVLELVLEQRLSLLSRDYLQTAPYWPIRCPCWPRGGFCIRWYLQSICECRHLGTPRSLARLGWSVWSREKRGPCHRWSPW